MEKLYEKDLPMPDRQKAEDVSLCLKRKPEPLAHAELSAPIQLKHAYRAQLEANPGVAGAMAKSGLQGGKSSLPHLEKIQAAFGRHKVSDVDAHVGGKAKEACDGLMAQAYATGGNSIVFARQPDLFVAAHEATHIVQQRSGVHIPKGLTPQEHDLEAQADRVAAAVVAGESAEQILDQYNPRLSTDRRLSPVKRQDPETHRATTNAPDHRPGTTTANEHIDTPGAETINEPDRRPGATTRNEFNKSPERHGVNVHDSRPGTTTTNEHYPSHAA